VLAFAVSMIDFEATGMPHLSQNRDSSVIVDPQLVQKPISTSRVILRKLPCQRKTPLMQLAA